MTMFRTNLPMLSSARPWRVYPVFVDDGFGKPVLASDVIQNRDGEFSSRCSTSKELFDFNVAVAQNR